MKRFRPQWVRLQVFLKRGRMLTLVSDPLDTTVRIRFPLKTYSNLSTPQAVSTFLSRFGATDEASIVLSTHLKGRKEKTDKPAKTGSALVPFRQIGDAFAAVCASERKDSSLDGIKISWVRGEEPAILGWLRKMGKLTRPQGALAQTSATQGTHSSADEEIKTELPRTRAKSPKTPFSSFPSSLVRTSSFFLFYHLMTTFHVA